MSKKSLEDIVGLQETIISRSRTDIKQLKSKTDSKSRSNEYHIPKETAVKIENHGSRELSREKKSRSKEYRKNISKTQSLKGSPLKMNVIC
jgi:hypothetical protein